MTPKKELIRISKFLSYVLRHNPAAIGLQLNEEGWAWVDELISCAARKGRNIALEQLKEVIATDEKKRFSFSPDGHSVRANYGHSIKVELNLKPVEPPAILYHGTAGQSIESILKRGIKASGRRYVHLSPDFETAVNVGKRHGKPIVLTIDSKKMYEDGFRFYCPVDGVWLVKDVPPGYLVVDCLM